MVIYTITARYPVLYFRSLVNAGTHVKQQLSRETSYVRTLFAFAGFGHGQYA